jgi:hypothetical protein
MPHRADAAFTIDDRATVPVDWPGGSMGRVRWIKTYTGELAAAGTLESIMCELTTEEGAPTARTLLGLERVEGELHGRKGSFALVHMASSLGEENRMELTIQPGSGTGELAGITGTGEILPGHDFVLDYELPS